MEYLILASVGFVAAITPGPDIFYVVQNAICKGRSAALWAVFGILTGNIVYLSLVGLGLGAIGQNSYFQFIVGVFGGFYLLKIAYLIFNDKPSITKSCDSYKKGAIYKEALFLNLSNPKAMLFFAVIVAPFMGKSLYISLISLFIGIAAAFFTAAFVASLFNINQKVLIAINKISSLIFVFFSISLFITAYKALLKIIS